jgi:hypothetical protein
MTSAAVSGRMTSATPVDGAQPADGEDKTMAIRPYTSPA